jgi:hypothetical protein
MKIKILALSLILLLVVPIAPRTALARQSRVIELVAKEGGSKIGTIYVNDQNLLAQFKGNSEALLFTAEAFYTINHKNKTYRVQTWDELQTGLSRKAGEIAQSQEKISGGPEIELKLTEETETISGFKTRKLIRTSRGEPDVVFWVASELTPMKLRAVGERIRAMLPGDYWKKVRGNPGMVEIIWLFGVPLRMTSSGHNFQAQVLESSIPDSSFQVPEGYRRIDN